MPYLEVNDLVMRAAMMHGKAARVRGIVRTGSIQKDPNGMTVKFVIESKTGSSSCRVRYYGIVPNAFGEGCEVLVDGVYDRTGFMEATRLLAKCPSKYEMQKTAAYQERPKEHVSIPTR